MRKPGHLWLLGLSGSGKSTLGPVLARQLNLPFYDTDELVTRKAQRPIPEIFAIEGEAGFRKRETEAIGEMEKQSPAVVACGGGAVLEAGNRRVMQRNGTRIYLRVPLKILEERLRHKMDRPLLTQGPLPTTLADQLAKREIWYQESEIQLDIGQDSPERVAQRILDKLNAES